DFFGQFIESHDFDVNSHQFGGETNILPALADSQRQLVFANQHDRPTDPWVDLHFFNLRRSKRVGNHNLQRFVVADDIDPLATQFIQDVLDTAAPNADARTNAVDFAIDAADRNLGPVTGLASDGADLDNVFGNFRDLLFEQPADKVRMRPRQDDLDSLTALADFGKI